MNRHRSAGSPSRSEDRSTGAAGGSAPAASETSLFLLFADHLVAPKTAVTRGVEVPGKEVKVQMAALARLLAACSLWSMREHGVVSLELRKEERKGVFGRKTVSVVRVDPTGKDATTGVERTSLALVPEEGTTALAVAKSLVGSSTDVPAWYLIRRFVLLAQIEGLVEVDEGFIKTKVHADAARVAALEPAFAEVREAWTTFVGREPDLHKALVDECKRGIDAMTDCV